MSVNHCKSCEQCKLFPCTCSTNYWILQSGVNMLKGCPCDPCNPVRLQDCFIIWALQHSIKARNDFCALYPALFPCEKERFDILFQDNPYYTKLVRDWTTVEDGVQANMNNIPVRTAGPDPFGGRRLPRRNVAQKLNLPPHLLPNKQPKSC